MAGWTTKEDTVLNARMALYYQLLDALATVIALQLSSYLRESIEVGMQMPPDAFQIPWILFPTAVLIWQIVFQVFHVYAVASTQFRIPLFSRLIEAHCIATMMFWGVLYIIYRDFSRLQTLYFVVIVAFLTLAGRWFWYFVRSKIGFDGRKKRKVLIVGVNSYAREIGRIITDYSSEGLQLLGFVPHKNEAVDPYASMILGEFDALTKIVAAQGVDEVIICDKSHSRLYLHQITEILMSLPVNVRLAPDYSELAYFHVSVEDFGGAPLISLRYDMLTSGQRFVKRLFDVVGAVLLLTAALPLIILIAIAIKLDSDGPVFFRQVRVGERGRLFMMLKFRTMVWDAESKITYTKYYKHADDPRVTRVGRWLRRASLDEIPQFLNVLRGDMTLVGPRPELPQIVEFYSPWQRKRFEVPQGVTGWWQINGRADLPMYEAVEYDVFYIRNYSIWLDLRILARTPLAILRGRGAF